MYTLIFRHTIVSELSKYERCDLEFKKCSGSIRNKIVTSPLLDFGVE